MLYQVSPWLQRETTYFRLGVQGDLARFADFYFLVFLVGTYTTIYG